MTVTYTIHVRTKFLGPTNYRGARIKAVSTSGESIVVHWDHALNVGDNHEAAFGALLAKLDREVTGPIYAADPFNDGYAFMAPTRYTGEA